MGSSGLGALTGAYVSVEEKGGLVALVNVGTNIQNLMIRSRLVETFEPFDSEDEAIEALNAE
jgi:anti-anti-sigma regulatory factor